MKRGQKGPAGAQVAGAASRPAAGARSEYANPYVPAKRKPRAAGEGGEANAQVLQPASRPGVASRLLDPEREGAVKPRAVGGHNGGNAAEQKSSVQWDEEEHEITDSSPSKRSANHTAELGASQQMRQRTLRLPQPTAKVAGAEADKIEESTDRLMVKEKDIEIELPESRKEQNKVKAPGRRYEVNNEAQQVLQRANEAISAQGSRKEMVSADILEDLEIEITGQAAHAEEGSGQGEPDSDVDAGEAAKKGASSRMDLRSWSATASRTLSELERPEKERSHAAADERYGKALKGFFSRHAAYVPIDMYSIQEQLHAWVSEEDLQSPLWSEMLRAVKESAEAAAVWTDEEYDAQKDQIYEISKSGVLVDFEREEESGRQYLRVLAQDYRYKRDEKDGITLIWLAVMRFDAESCKFETHEEDIILLDVVRGEVDEKHTRRCDWYLPHKNNTYFFRKEIIKKESALKFHLFRHQVEQDREFDVFFEQAAQNDDRDSKGQESSAKKSRELQQMIDYSIQAPSGWLKDPENDNLAIYFMLSANNERKDQIQRKRDFELLDGSFVMIVKRVIEDAGPGNRFSTDLLIYSLAQPKEPIVQIEEAKFDSVQIGFFIQDAGGEVTFSILGTVLSYQIAWDGHTPIRSFEQVKVFEHGRDPGICNTHFRMNVQFEAVELQRAGTKADTVTVQQAFFLDFKSQPVLVHPLYAGDKKTAHSGLLNPLSSTIDQLNSKVLGNRQGKLVSREPGQLIFATPDFVDNILKAPMSAEQADDFDAWPEGDQDRDPGEFDHYWSTDNVIIKANAVRPPEIHLWTLADYRLGSSLQQNIQSYREKEAKREENAEGGSQLMVRLLEQFHHEYQEIYQDNYQVKQFMHLENQFLGNFYLNREKERVFMQHNKVMVGSDQTFEVGEEYLLINLKEGSNELELLKLYDEDIKDLKLLKYQVSFSAHIAVFFFLKRNILADNEDPQRRRREAESGGQSGLHLLVKAGLEELASLALDGRALVTRDTHVCPMRSFAKMEKWMPFGGVDKSTKSDIESLQDNIRQNICAATSVYFELVHDFATPCQDMVPFIFFEEVDSDRGSEDQGLAGGRRDGAKSQSRKLFEPYFCVLNMNRLASKQAHLQSQQGEDVFEAGDESFEMGTLWLQRQRIQVHQNNHATDHQETAYWEERSPSLHRTQAPLFQRCSDWQGGLRDAGSGEMHAARYQVGFPFEDEGVQIYEVHEYLLCIYESQVEPPREIMDLEMIGLHYLIKSWAFQQKCISNMSKYAEDPPCRLYANDRLLPDIADDGSINGCFLMINTFCTEKPPMTLRDHPAESLAHPHLRKSPKLARWLQGKKGQKALVTHIGGWFDEFTAHFEDGEEVTIRGQERHYLFAEESKQDKYRIKPHFFYEMVKIASDGSGLQDAPDQERGDEDEDAIIPIQSKLANELYSVAISKVALRNQPRNQVKLVQVGFQKDAILKQVFEQRELAHELHEQMKMVLAMSLPNFRAALPQAKDQRCQNYFQPRYILKGRNFCYLDFDSFHQTIQNLQDAVDFIQEERQGLKAVNFFSNSVAFEFFMSPGAVEDIDAAAERMQSFCRASHLNSYFGLQTNFLKAESVITRGLDLALVKPVFYIFDFLIEQNVHADLWEVLVQDMPQFLSQDKININPFFDIQSNELLPKGAEDEGKCNLGNFELPLVHKELPMLGDQRIKNFKLKIENLRNTKEQAIEAIVENFDQEATSNSELTFEERLKKGKQVELVHSIVDFQPVIRKIKIDKFLKRKASKKTHTKYLNTIEDRPKDVAFDTLLMTELMYLQANNEDNLDFYGASTVQKLIDLQFSRTRSFMHVLYVVYLLGFCAPLATNVVVNKLYMKREFERGEAFNVSLSRVLNFIMFITQVGFFLLEIAELGYAGVRAYFRDPFNFLGVAQFLVFLVYMGFSIANHGGWGEHDGSDLVQSITEILLFVSITSKVLEFLRTWHEYRFIIQMIMQVFIDVRPFITIFFFFVAFFTMCMISLEGQVCDDDFCKGDDDDYPHIWKILRVFIQVFRNSVGDIGAPIYDEWGDNLDDRDAEGSSFVSIYLLWFVWLCNVFLMLIVMLNFLIAEVGNTYQKASALGEKYHYRERAILNHQSQKYISFFRQRYKYSAIAFSTPRGAFKDGDYKEVFNVGDVVKAELDRLALAIRTELRQVQAELGQLIQQTKM